MCFEDVSSYENRTKSGAIKAMLRESWGCGHLPNSVCNSYAWLSLFGHALRNMISAAFSFNTAFLQCFYSSVWHLLWPLWTFGTPELGPRLRSVAVVAPSKYWCVGARLQQQRRKLVQPLVPSDLTPKSSASFCVTPSHHRVTKAQKSWCCQNVGRGCVLHRCEGQVSDWSISEREWHLGTSQTEYCIWRNGEDWTNVKNRHLNFNIKEILN